MHPAPWHRMYLVISTAFRHRPAGRSTDHFCANAYPDTDHSRSIWRWRHQADGSIRFPAWNPVCHMCHVLRSRDRRKLRRYYVKDREARQEGSFRLRSVLSVRTCAICLRRRPDYGMVSRLFIRVGLRCLWSLRTIFTA